MKKVTYDIDYFPGLPLIIRISLKWIEVSNLLKKILYLFEYHEIEHKNKCEIHRLDQRISP